MCNAKPSHGEIRVKKETAHAGYEGSGYSRK